METGDFEIASNALYSCTYRHLICGTPRAHAKKQADEHEELIERLGHQIPLYRHRIFQQTLDNLLSEKKNTTKWEGRHYSKKQFLGLHQAAQDTTTLFLLNFVQLLHHFTFSDYLTAHHFSQRAEMHLGSVTSSLFVPILTFYSVLTRLQLCRSYSGAQKIFKIGNVLTGIKKLKKWAYHCPQNYLHKYHLALAELNSVIGKNNKALSFYDLAIKGAKKNDYPQDRAIAQELIASHLSRLNHTELAALNLQESYISYLQWGASAKAIQMKKRHPQLAAFSRKAEVNTGINLEQTIPAQAIPDIDISAMIKATKLMNGSIIEDELQTNILTTLLENAGAQKGYLIFENNGEWTVTLCGYLEESGVNIEVHPPNRARPSLSLNIVQYVARTNESVVLGRPLTEGLFTQDSYIQKNKPQSIMCLPLVYKEKISGIVYLENNLASEAFSKKRQDIIFSICTQAAVSLKNSSLYSELEKTVEKLHLEIKKRKSTQLQLLQAEKLAALGRLSASIAHEFGNPMIGIQYLLQDILTRFSMSLEDEKLIEVGIEECQRMKILIRDMQQLNRPSSGRKRQFDPHKAIQNVLLFQKKNLSNHKIRVVRKLAKNIRPIMAVEDQITQVLVNITLNAVDAMTENGGTLTISTHQDSDFLDIVVRDTGCGIALNDQKNIFEPFFSTKPNVDGTGLGLPISYSIVKNHDGDILFSSTPAEGSTFHIKLPCNIAN